VNRSPSLIERLLVDVLPQVEGFDADVGPVHAHASGNSRNSSSFWCEHCRSHNGANVAAALNHAKHYSPVFAASAGDNALAFGLMHVPSLAADE
jgi:hypothetical protein